MKTINIISALILMTCANVLAEPFNTIKFSKDINTHFIDTISQSISNDVNSSGIVIKSDSTIKFYTDDADIAIEGIFVNDKSLEQIINEKVYSKVMDLKKTISTQVSESLAHSENPLWGRKISIVGDSEAAGASNYSMLIAQRNNMTAINHAVGGTALVGSKENNALFPNYRDWIATDSDYILVQIGCNDGGSWNQNDDDESTDTSKFKGAWNTFLQNLKIEYPQAKKAIIMPYYWNTNGGRDVRVQWMKTRCNKYNLEYIDGVESLGFSPSTHIQYFNVESGVPSPYHFSSIGHQRASYVYEHFLKTRVQFSK